MKLMGCSNLICKVSNLPIYKEVYFCVLASTAFGALDLPFRRMESQNKFFIPLVISGTDNGYGFVNEKEQFNSQCWDAIFSIYKINKDEFLKNPYNCKNGEKLDLIPISKEMKDLIIEHGDDLYWRNSEDLEKMLQSELLSKMKGKPEFRILGFQDEIFTFIENIDFQTRLESTKIFNYLETFCYFIPGVQASIKDCEFFRKYPEVIKNLIQKQIEEK
jgi:hypothetical protein